MQASIDVITRAGHSALDVALYTLLPIMVVITIVLRMLEVYGVGVACGPLVKIVAEARVFIFFE